MKDERVDAMEVEPTGKLAKIRSVEWLGQTIASFCWMASVVAFGLNSVSDWLQLLAAGAWIISNAAGLFAPRR